MAKGEYLATVTDNDFDISFSGHATGGTLTALFNKKKGPVIMGSVTDYVLVEPRICSRCWTESDTVPCCPVWNSGGMESGILPYFIATQ